MYVYMFLDSLQKQIKTHLTSILQDIRTYLKTTKVLIDHIYHVICNSCNGNIYIYEENCNIINYYIYIYMYIWFPKFEMRGS